jgi:YidC/Oxa1 family membrane protein insertase
MGWQKFYLEPRMPKTAATAPAASGTASSQEQAKSGGTIVPQKQASKPLESRSIALGSGEAFVGNGAKVFTGWNLKSYRLGISPEAAAVDLKSLSHQDGGETELAFERQELAYLTGVQGTLSSIPGGVSWKYEDENVKLVREMVSPDGSPFVELTIRGEFKKDRPSYAFVSLNIQGAKDDPEAQDRHLLYWDKAVERVHVEEAIDQKAVAGPVKWIGVTNRYFLMSLVNREGARQAQALVQPAGTWAGKISMVYPISQNSFTIPLRAYFGPKELYVLRSVEPTLGNTVDFGWFTFFAYPLLQLMKWLQGLVGNWGVAIILLTVLVRVAIFPLNYKSAKSMKKMAAVQPQLAKIREKYANDREALNREMLTIMRSNGVNPMAGCLPILIQMPVWIALYRVLYSSIELYHAPFMLWIHDLSAKDPFYVTPVLLTGMMFIQQKLMPMTGTDPMQQKMMQFMPVIFGLMMISLPSGLTVYMLISTVIGIGQQLFMNKKLGITNAPAVAAGAR